MNLEGNTILITGGGSGIGLGLAEAFHKRGNRVIIGGRRRDVLDRATDANPGMEAVTLNTADPASVQAAANQILKNHPKLNVVINNAGIQRVFDYATHAPDEAELSEEIDTNIKGVLRLVSAFLPHLKEQHGAAIVNVSSGLAFVPIARFPIYCATKAFVHSFTMSLRQQLRNTGIQVIELAPPWVATDLDARQKTIHEGMQPMPLADFIAAAMEDLGSDSQELPVAGAKFLYSSGVSEQVQDTFRRINA